MRLACNTVKHAEGGSAKKFKKKRKEVFTPSILKDLADDGESPVYQRMQKIFQPMAGEDVYLEPEDIKTYGEAIKTFWNELAEKITEQANSPRL